MLSVCTGAYTRSMENGERKKSLNSLPVRLGRAEQGWYWFNPSSGAILPTTRKHGCMAWGQKPLTLGPVTLYSLRHHLTSTSHCILASWPGIARQSVLFWKGLPRDQKRYCGWKHSTTSRNLHSEQHCFQSKRGSNDRPARQFGRRGERPALNPEWVNIFVKYEKSQNLVSSDLNFSRTFILERQHSNLFSAFIIHCLHFLGFLIYNCFFSF